MSELLPISENPDAFRRRGFSGERLIRYFFASNAGLTILIFVLIIAFLMKEGLGFFPGYKRELEIYRITGMEYVDISRTNLTSHEQLVSVLNRAYYSEINGQADRELQRSKESAAIVTVMDDFGAALRDQYFTAIDPDRPEPAVAESIKQRYIALMPLATRDLPASPHLTAEERQAIIDAMLARPIDQEDRPAIVTAMAAEYAAAQQKFASPLESNRALIDEFESTSRALSERVSEMTGKVKVTKDALAKADIIERDRKTLLAAAASAKTAEERERLTADAEAAIAEVPDVATPLAELMQARSECITIHRELATKVQEFSAKLAFQYQQTEAKKLATVTALALPVYLADLQQAPALLENWDAHRPVHLSAAIRSFLTGKNWVTGGEWQDFYGILPLFIGSLMIAIVALTIAIPAGVGAAIYTNQFASAREQKVIKPVIEFIQAIPSVVLGFIGIFVLGNALRELSTVEMLSWFPGFPMEERLNIFTAGCLLALMSIPTIFSLSEDAINNVPSTYSEASEALGASKLQTTFRVVIPAAFSGILAAILLGFGRVIGETMVVLLVAGNRIKIPDFSSGIGAFFQPAHTMTGIIAQELGEVPIGSVHYRALFVVGILLFAIVLCINAIAHRYSNKMKH
jgi:phosphate transport system permease protein